MTDFQKSKIEVIFGTICYLRNFFDENTFETIEYALEEPMINDNKKMKFKILKNTEESKIIFKWIEELNKHLNNIFKITFAIYNYKNEIVEIYSFDFQFVIDFRGFCKILQKMNLLTGKYYMKLKVFAYQVDLKGFEKKTEIWDIEDSKKIELRGTKVIYKSMNDKIEEGMDDSRIFKSRMAENKMNFFNKEQNDIIDCACTINTNEAFMLQCKTCLCWVHAICCGFFSYKDKRISHDFICYKCTELVTNELRNCCIYRRVLWIIYQEETSYRNLSSRLKISNPFAQKIIRKLKEDKFLVYDYKISDFSPSKEDNAKNKIKEYFNGLRMECSISIDELEYNFN